MKKGQILDPGSERRSLSKKIYVPPELQEWGSVMDLTQGKRAQLQDSPAKGGTFVV